jgi:flavorubredoxin
MKPREIRPGIFAVGAVDWDRRLFDALIPLPDGTTYNSYLIKGKDKTVLIDTVDPEKIEVLLAHLQELDIKNIDYIITHHAEQDHSGSLPVVLEKYSSAKVMCTPKCKTMLIDLSLATEDRIITVEDKENISLGDKTLEFIYTPWVHWPETMTTYLKEERILFSCDFFGAHLANSDLYVKDDAQLYESAKRYYAEIMMPFRTVIQNNLQKIKDYKFDVIAPSHGPVHDKPEFILNAYKSWAYDEPKNTVILPYVSMHGSTAKMVDYFTGALMDRGVTVKRFDLTTVDVGKMAMSLIDAATIVIGTPTVLAGPHPLAAYAAFLANALRANTKFVSIIGSYGWGGKTVDILAGMITSLKVEVLDPVICKGFPGKVDFEALDKLADLIADKHQQNKYV